MSALAVILLALAAADGAAPPAAGPPPATAPADVELFLMPVTVDDEALRPVARSIERRLGQRLGDAGHVTMTSQDVAALFDLEAARQSAGCDDEASCAAELAGSLGADRVVTGSLSRLDDRYRLDLTLSDRKAARVLGRGRASGRTADELERDLDAGIARLFGVEAAPAAGPSPLVVVGGVGVGVGAVTALVGGALGVQALLARADLEAAGARFDDTPDGANLRALSVAHGVDTSAGQTWNTIGLPLVAVGTALAVAGGVALAVGLPGEE